MSENIRSEEISLIDIIAILIRYRRIIILFTALSVLLSGAAAIIIPLYQYSKSVAAESYEGNMVCRPSAGLYNLIRKDDAAQYAVLILRDPSVILGALESAGVENINGIKLDGDRSSRLSLVRYSFVGSLMTVKKNNDDIVVQVRLGSEKDAHSFMETLMAEVNSRLRIVLEDVAQAEISGFEKISNIEYPKAVIEENLLTTIQRYYSAMSFLSGEEPGLVNVQGPVVYKSTLDKSALRNNVIRKGIIISAAVFFLMAIFSFILNWIDYIRHDETSMKKLRAALKRERF